jgi:glycerophosphoryl diester phosphodiesterase
MTSVKTSPKIIGHRGAAGHAPENTLASMRRAHQLGATWVEIDVKLTKDDVPILMHDATLARTTSCRGTVADMTWAELAGCDAGGWFAGEFAGEPIPTLAALVELLNELSMGLNLEIKPCPGREAETGRVVAEVFPGLWPAHLPAPVISSFSIDALAAYAAVAPGMERALIVHGLPDDWAAIATRLGLKAMHCDAKRLKRHQAADMLAAGLAVRCYTVNDRDVAKRLFEWGIESVISDYPDRMP